MEPEMCTELFYSRCFLPRSGGHGELPGERWGGAYQLRVLPGHRVAAGHPPSGGVALCAAAATINQSMQALPYLPILQKLRYPSIYLCLR